MRYDNVVVRVEDESGQHSDTPGYLPGDQAAEQGSEVGEETSTGEAAVEALQTKAGRFGHREPSKRAFGLTLDQLVERWGISRRSVYRILDSGRSEEGMEILAAESRWLAARRQANKVKFEGKGNKEWEELGF